eukprot:scaffold180191_cov20-Prasinocladus_malaysianus.AAC.1
MFAGPPAAPALRVYQRLQVCRAVPRGDAGELAALMGPGCFNAPSRLYPQTCYLDSWTAPDLCPYGTSQTK